MTLTVTTWLWGEHYGIDYLLKLQASVGRHLRQPYRFVCVTDSPERLAGTGVETIAIEESDRPLLEIKGCFARLRMFDPHWQRRNDIRDRLVNIDLDTVITGPLDPLFDRPEPFVILQRGNAANPCPYNGALMMLRAGAHPDVWSDFSIAKAARARFYDFPDDQGWIWDRVPDAAGWICGVETGVFVFHKPGWPEWDKRTGKIGRDDLPKGARLVTFSGWRTPMRFSKLPWVKENWR